MFDVVGVCKRVKTASYSLCGYSSAQKNNMLLAIADALRQSKNVSIVINANEQDVAQAVKNGKSDTFIDRLTLTQSRIEAMIEGLEQVAVLPDPVGEIVEETMRPNGLDIKRIRVPLGVVGIIYEARPNVTVDAAALCLKSGNGVVLRGSKDALNSNRALYCVMKDAIRQVGLESDCIGFMDDPSHEAGKALLEQDKYIDVIIPRGGEGLKRFVIENATMPVIASAGGNCHIYVEKTADLDMARDIVVNAKCQRPSTCNAAEHLLVDAEIADKFLPIVFDALKASHNVDISGDERSKSILPNITTASEQDYQTEFLTYKMTFKVINSVEEAVDLINKYGTKHSEAIVTNDDFAKTYFEKYVDAAAVYVNASTRFTDGFEFGLGAEIGISTQKLHVRGPIGLKELTCVKYVVNGNGQIRK